MLIRPTGEGKPNKHHSGGITVDKNIIVFSIAALGDIITLACVIAILVKVC